MNRTLVESPVARDSLAEILGHLRKSARNLQDAHNPLLRPNYQLHAVQQSVQHLAQAFCAVTGRPVGFDEPTVIENMRWMITTLPMDDILKAEAIRMISWRVDEEALRFRAETLATVKKVRQAISCVKRVRRIAREWFHVERPDIAFRGQKHKLGSQS